jgi:DNA-binding MarR family transcriptional regulator
MRNHFRYPFPMAGRSDTDEQLLEHPYLTTLGLLVEAFEGFHSTMSTRVEAHSGVSSVWFGILIRLARTPGRRLRMSDLAAQTSMSASGLTRAVDRLESAGLVERQACPSDRRGQECVLTDDGMATVLKALPAHVAQLTEAIDTAFTPAELEQFTGLMRKLRDAANPCAAAHSSPFG